MSLPLLILPHTVSMPVPAGWQAPKAIVRLAASVAPNVTHNIISAQQGMLVRLWGGILSVDGGNGTDVIQLESDPGGIICADLRASPTVQPFDFDGADFDNSGQGLRVRNTGASTWLVRLAVAYSQTPG